MPTRRDALPFVYQSRPSRRPSLGRVDPRRLAFFAIALGIIGLAGWLYLQQASVAALHAHEIGELEREKERLHREVVALRAEVALMGSLERILEEADELGYSLPDASDKSRHLHVVIEPLPQPTSGPVVEEAGEDSRARQSEDLGLHQGGFFQRLVDQLRGWIESPLGGGDSQ